MHNLGALTSVPGAIIENLIKDSINKPSEVRDIINVFQNSPTKYRPSRVQEKYIFWSRKVSEIRRYANATPNDSAAKISTTHHC